MLLKTTSGTVILWWCFSIFTFAQPGGRPEVVDPSQLNSIQIQAARYADAGMYDSAIFFEQKAKTILLKQREISSAIECQLRICNNLYYKRDFPEARKAVQQGLDETLRLNPSDTINLADLYNFSGVLYYSDGDYEKALAEMKKALLYQRSSIADTSPKTLATKYNNIAAIVSRLGDYDEAIYYYHKSLLLREQHGSPLEIGQVYNNLSVSYYRKKMFKEALDYQLRYLAVLDKLDDDAELTKKYILSYNALGIYYFELEDYDRAIATLKKAFALNKKDEYLEEKTWHNLGYVYRQQGEVTKALHFLNGALKRNTSKHSGTHPDVGKEYRHLGVIYAEQGDTEKALRYYQKALSNIVDNFNDSSWRKNPLLENIRSKPDLLRTLRDKADALQHIARIKSDNNLLYAAWETSQLAMKLVEQMRDEYESAGGRRFINEEAIPVYESALLTLSLMQETKMNISVESEAYSVMEKSQALLLNESLQRKKNATSLGVPDSLRRKERRAQIAIGYYSQQIENETDSARRVMAETYLTYWQDTVRQLQVFFKKRYPRYHSLARQFKISGIENLRTFLTKENSCVTEYFLGDEYLWTLLITPEHTRFIQKKLPDQWSTWISQYRRSLRDFNFITDSSALCYAQYKKSAYELYKFLLGDVIPLIENQERIIIIPHAELAYIPFEALLTEPAPGTFNGYASLKYLLNDRVISYTYSSSLHLALHEQPQPISSKCLGLSPSFKNRKLSTLPYTRQELEHIEKLFSGQYYYDQEATKTAFQQSASEYGIIHLATHTIIDETDPGNSRIFFADTEKSDSSALYGYEIANLSLHADLVVVSACETGAGKLANGEGVMSLGHSFMYAGARSVVMNLWQAEDKVNAAIMETFYDALDDGQSKSQSLRKAKLQYLQSTDAFGSHPAFWAGYVLTGHENQLPPIYKPWQEKMLWLGTLSILIAMASMLWYKKRK